MCLVMLHIATWVCFQTHNIGFITCLQVNFWWFQILICNPSMEFQSRVHEVLIYSDLRTSHLWENNAILMWALPTSTVQYLLPSPRCSCCESHKCTPQYQELLFGWLMSTCTLLHIYERRHCTVTKCMMHIPLSVRGLIASRALQP